MSRKPSATQSRQTVPRVLMADRRDALVDLATLTITSRTLSARDIAPALEWIGANRAYCLQVFKECNP